MAMPNQATQECRVSSEIQVPAGIPDPFDGERPVAYADRAGEWYTARQSMEHRKSLGLYLTPVPVADFMAGQIRVSGDHIRVLDPGGGGGILACAAVEALVSCPSRPGTIELVVYEIDERLVPVLDAVFGHLVLWCRNSFGVTLKVTVEVGDFVLAQAGALRLLGGFLPCMEDGHGFDIVISNPPYFKLNKADPRAMAAANVVHGQPNIYSIFMAVGAALLKQHGDFIFIIPRSFASGPYFRRFRTVFFNMIRPNGVHVFDSRRKAFGRDKVLQENIIFAGMRTDSWHRDRHPGRLVLSSSEGIDDIAHPPSCTVPMESVIDMASADRVLRLPLSHEDDWVLALVDSWPNTLGSLGLKISTGPVVPFRATGLIDGEGEVPTTHVPLLWMNHVRAMDVTWPLQRHKPEFIKRASAQSVLVPNRNYVLLRRFSAKEEVRRLVAAPYLAGRFAVPELGLENHLNYIHRPGGTLTEDEAWGLAALYNSRLLDTYFRAINGNTQVSATELRAMPLPSHGRIVALGRRAKNFLDPRTGFDALVMDLAVQDERQEAAVG